MADREPSIRNEAVAWSDFDAGEYWKINYAAVLPEDAEIIQCASKFLIEACGEPTRSKRAVDVGAGTNLYPSLLMLPWAASIVFTEYASPNIGWLSQNLAAGRGEWRWQPFWDLIAGLPCYRGIDDPRRRLEAVHEIRTESIFDLPERTWDIGSMFFVADGMTTDEAEFEAAFAPELLRNDLIMVDSAAVLAGTVSVCSVMVVILAPCAVNPATITWITPVRGESKWIVSPGDKGDGLAMAI